MKSESYYRGVRIEDEDHARRKGVCAAYDCFQDMDEDSPNIASRLLPAGGFTFCTEHYAQLEPREPAEAVDTASQPVPFSWNAYDRVLRIAVRELIRRGFGDTVGPLARKIATDATAR